MATLLYVRTGNTGTDPDVLIDDLGAIIPIGATWTLISASSPPAALGSGGQFTARELRDSEDLYLQITGGTLEWSKDGVALEPAADYLADYMLVEDFSDDRVYFDANRLILNTDGTLTYTGLGDLAILAEPYPKPVED